MSQIEKRALKVESSSEDEAEPPKKKQMSRRTCLVCDVEKGINQFPSPKRVSSHEHEQNVCRPCYLSHLNNEIDSKNWDEVACPECPITLTYKEVENMTNAENFAKYDQACISATLAADQDFRHCFSTTCDSGQIHPGGADEPIFRCQECGHKHCVACQANWHQDQTCEEFQALREKRNVEDEKSQQEVNKISKQCPKCTVAIQKNTGCDHMTCSRCRHQFCWICSADYTDIFREGNQRHAESCSHYRAIATNLPQTIARIGIFPRINPNAVPTPARTVQATIPPTPRLTRTIRNTITTDTSGRESTRAEERPTRREARRTARRAERAARAAGNA